MLLGKFNFILGAIKNLKVHLRVIKKSWLSNHKISTVWVFQVSYC